MSDTSSEFRSVHAAKEALDIYLNSGRNLKTIKSIPFNSISRYDVWQSVFEKETEAFRVLQEKELYSMFMDKELTEGTNSLLSMLCVTMLDRINEFDSPLSVQDAIKIMVDTLGEGFLNEIRSEAQVSYETRVEIVRPYYKKDNEWVLKSKNVVDFIDEEIKAIKKGKGDL